MSAIHTAIGHVPGLQEIYLDPGFILGNRGKSDGGCRQFRASLVFDDQEEVEKIKNVLHTSMGYSFSIPVEGINVDCGLSPPLPSENKPNVYSISVSVWDPKQGIDFLDSLRIVLEKIATVFEREVSTDGKATFSCKKAIPVYGLLKDSMPDLREVRVIPGDIVKGDGRETFQCRQFKGSLVFDTPIGIQEIAKKLSPIGVDAFSIKWHPIDDFAVRNTARVFSFECSGIQSFYGLDTSPIDVFNSLNSIIQKVACVLYPSMSEEERAHAFVKTPPVFLVDESYDLSREDLLSSEKDFPSSDVPAGEECPASDKDSVSSKDEPPGEKS